MKRAENTLISLRRTAANMRCEAGVQPEWSKVRTTLNAFALELERILPDVNTLIEALWECRDAIAVARRFIPNSDEVLARADAMLLDITAQTKTSASAPEQSAV